MQKKYLVISALTISIVSFYVGTQFASADTTSKTDIKKVENKDTTVVEVVKPDGSKTTTTKIIYVGRTDSTNTSQTKHNQPSVNIHALAGLSFTGQPAYGAHISKRIIGPISLGVFAVSSGVAGLSLGVSL